MSVDYKNLGIYKLNRPKRIEDLIDAIQQRFEVGCDEMHGEAAYEWIAHYYETASSEQRDRMRKFLLDGLIFTVVCPGANEGVLVRVLLSDWNLKDSINLTNIKCWNDKTACTFQTAINTYLLKIL